MVISSGLKVVGAFVGFEGVERVGDDGPKVVYGAYCSLSQKGLEL